jgi:hypothetical protein
VADDDPGRVEVEADGRGGSDNEGDDVPSGRRTIKRLSQTRVGLILDTVVILARLQFLLYGSELPRVVRSRLDAPGSRRGASSVREDGLLGAIGLEGIPDFYPGRFTVLLHTNRRFDLVHDQVDWVATHRSGLESPPSDTIKLRLLQPNLLVEDVDRRRSVNVHLDVIG